MKRNLHAGRRRSGGLSFSVFTDDEISDIHLSTLEVLERTGIWVEDDDALDAFAEGGAQVDRASRIVRIPSYVVEDAISAAPSGITLCGRTPENDIILEANRVGFTNFGEGIKLVDPHSGELREPTKRDVAEATRLIDALPDVDVLERPMGAHDVPQDAVPLHNAEAILSNTTKHVFIGPINGLLLKKIVQMAAAVVGGVDNLRRRPLVSFITCPISPLKLVKDCCEIIMESARAGMAVNVLSMAMAGGSSPVTLAGTLVTHNAEVLGGITLAQLTARGAPVIYGSSTTAMDLRLASASVGSPECGLINAGVAQLARFYLLPSWVAGAQGDAKLGDAQSGHEKTLTGLLPALAGANLIYGLGMLESGVTFDYGQLLMDAEFARLIKFAVAGIVVDDETLMVDDIHAVGSQHDFLSLDSTYKYMRSQSQPKLIDRRVREDWAGAGATDLYQRATAEARRILETHKPEPLPQEVAAELRTIVEAAEKELGVESVHAAF